MPSPFETHAAVLRNGSYGASQRLQDLVLSLWNGEGWPLDMGRLARNADTAHWAIAVSLLESYRRHGETDPAFMMIAAELADQRRADRGDEDCVPAVSQGARPPTGVPASSTARQGGLPGDAHPRQRTGAAGPRRLANRGGSAQAIAMLNRQDFPLLCQVASPAAACRCSIHDFT